MRRPFAAVLLMLALAAPRAHGEETAVVCFNYGCSSRTVVRFDEAALAAVANAFHGVASPVAERDALAHAVGRLYALAALATPIGHDHGENVYDGGVEGSMDCIDHSSNTSEFIAIAERRGWLRHHHASARVRRGWFMSAHWTATIVEDETGARYAVDSWFLDPGEPAFVQPLGDWRSGARPPRLHWPNLGG
jgi:hypothetical protein